jgi:hypothetical protein
VIRIGTWNLAQRSPHGMVGRLQAAAMLALDRDIWLLTEVPTTLSLEGFTFVRSTDSIWSAIATRLPVTPIATSHAGLALATIEYGGLPVLVACSVLPWRGAGSSWPGDPKLPLAVRFAQTLAVPSYRPPSPAAV